MNGVYQEPQFDDDGAYVRYQAPSNYININARNPQQCSNSNNDAFCSPACDTVAPTTQESKKTKWPKWAKTFAIILMIFIIFLVAAVAVVLVKVHQSETNQPGATRSRCDFPIKSCLDLKNQGEAKSGYYQIQPDLDGSPFETYCDMETSGGGWSLVASVHENDISGRCTTSDMWFSRESKESNGFISRNWENKFSFGTARSATSSDYKNPGFYAINASDVLVRHAPNNERIETTKDTAFLEYHTENQFLKHHGGNLHGVYSHQYNLSTIPIERNFVTETEAMLDALAGNASDIISGIPDFYKYQYSSSSTSLNNGNDNMFTNYGMRVDTPYCSYSYITYGTKQRCENRHIFTSSRKTTPFFALSTIGHYFTTTFYYRVRGYRYSNDTVTTYGDTLAKGNFTLKYNAYCRSGNSVPSVCDVMYVVSNKQQWKSSDFSFSSLSIYGSYSPYYARQEVNGDIKNIVFGYTMLSRPIGSDISQYQIRDVVQKILIIFSRFSSIGNTCDDSKLNLVQPVKYTIGSTTVLGGVPTSLRADVTPGFMQFRAWNTDGVTFAFCPAVRVNTCDSKHLCVGGVGLGTSIEDYCNDYLNWNSGSSLSSLNFHDPGSTSRPRQYIESTILFFYR